MEEHHAQLVQAAGAVLKEMRQVADWMRETHVRQDVRALMRAVLAMMAVQQAQLRRCAGGGARREAKVAAGACAVRCRQPNLPACAGGGCLHAQGGRAWSPLLRFIRRVTAVAPTLTLRRPSAATPRPARRSRGAWRRRWAA